MFKKITFTESDGNHYVSKIVLDSLICLAMKTENHTFHASTLKTIPEFYFIGTYFQMDNIYFKAFQFRT